MYTCLRLGLDELARLPVQAGPLQEEAVDVDTLRWGVVDILPREPRHKVLHKINF